MARFSLVLCLAVLFLEASEDKAKETKQSKQPVVIEDKTGISKKELRKKAKEMEKKDKKPLKVRDVVDSIDENGTVKVSKLLKQKWEELSPTPKDGFDWIQTVYGDWLKGHIRSMYDEEIEFDSKEFGIYTFKLSDISQMKSYDIMSVNIDNVAIFKGLIRYKNNKITIISGDNSYTFDKNMIISISGAKEKEINKWVGDISFLADVRSGNNEQADFSLKIFLQRRTPKNRLGFDYLGRYTSVKKEKTAEDNRLFVKYDRFFTKKFFVTPLFGEYYQNYFQNLKAQITVGTGVGYSIYNTTKTKWDVTAGPAYLQTNYYERLENGEDNEKSVSFEVSSKYEYKINKLNKLKLDYKFTITDKESGGYKHHSVLKLENDIIKDKIYIDTSFIWDYIDSPQPLNDATIPQKSDFQVLVGAGVRF
jgi:hypothetical protein